MARTEHPVDSGSPSTPTLVLVHGAWGGGWYWEATANLLRERGFTVHAIEKLPSNTGQPEHGLAADAEFVSALIDELGGRVVLVGHSYGGMVISQFAADPRVATAVYLTAFLPKHGQSFIEAAGGKLAPWIEVDDVAKVSRIAEAAVAKVVTAGMTDEEAAPVVASLGPQSLASFAEPSNNKAWGDTPVTYIVCTTDRVIPEVGQRAMAAQVPGVVILEIATGHFPMFTTTEETASAIAAGASRVGAISNS